MAPSAFPCAAYPRTMLASPIEPRGHAVKPARFLAGQATLVLRVSEQHGEPLFAGAGEVHDAAARCGIARRPVQFGEAVHDGGAERASEVMAAFAPVEAGLAHGAARVRQRFGVDLERLGHEALALASEFDVLF